MSSASSWPQAGFKAYNAVPVLEPVRRPLAACLKSVLAEDLYATTPMPHYASSAMDGWAVAGSAPWSLQKTGPLTAGTAAPIITGALIPEGATAVLRSESGAVAAGELHLNAAAAADEPWPGQHVRRAGTEASPGDLLISAGEVLTPARLGVAAGAACDTLSIQPRPVVDIVSTGDEVVAEGLPGPGQVRDTFTILLPESVANLGGEVRDVQHLPDDPRQLADALTSPGADVVITTGGTGTSHADHLRNVLAGLGADVVVQSIAMRPGHPALLAVLPGGKVVVGLPGNPLAAMMALLTLGKPLFARLAGRPLPDLRSVVSASELQPLAGRHRLLPATESPDGVSPVDRIGSGMLRGLGAADCVLVVPPGGLVRGDQAQVIELPW